MTANMNLPAPLRVLMVEDQPDHQALIQRHLRQVRQQRITVQAVDRLAAAVDLLGSEPFDAVLLDLHLPDSLGLETVTRLRDVEPRAALIVLSALDDEEVAMDAVRLGAEDYLIKSELSSELLSRAIRYAVERRRQRQALEAYAAELERSNRELDDFAHVASHELKTPLWVIRYAMQTLDEIGLPPMEEDDRKIWEGARTSLDQATTVINNLLAYARVSGAKATQPIAADEALKSAVEQLQVMIDESGTRLEHQPLPRVMADTEQLAHVFRNLIGNAIKYRRTRPHIRIEARRNGEECQFNIVDNGIGIEPRLYERVFNLFDRGNQPGQADGTGVGLAICKRIIERQGGRIWVESKPGEGSVFSFTLPCERNGHG